MSHLADLGAFGELPAQHLNALETGWLSTRINVLRKVRYSGLDPNTRKNLADAKTRGFSSVDGVWFAAHAQDPDGNTRDAALWAHAVAATTQPPVVGTQGTSPYSPTTRVPSSTTALPAFSVPKGSPSDGWIGVNDTGVVAQPVAGPTGDLPGGVPGIALPLSTWTRQDTAFVPAGNLLIDPWHGGASTDKYGTVVWDVTASGSLDPMRRARIQSAWRVWRLPRAGVIPFGAPPAPTLANKGASPLMPGGLAWQLNLDVGGQAGWGFVADKPDDGAARATTGSSAEVARIQKALDVNAQRLATAIAAGSAGENAAQQLNDERNSLMAQLAAAQGGGSTSSTPAPPGGGSGQTTGRDVPGSAPAQALAAMGRGASGPINAGGASCPHILGTNDDGETCYSGHLDEAFLVRGPTGDAPFAFDPSPWQVPDAKGPHVFEVFCRNDLNSTHSGVWGPKTGRRRWETTGYIDEPPPGISYSTPDSERTTNAQTESSTTGGSESSTTGGGEGSESSTTGGSESGVSSPTVEATLTSGVESSTSGGRVPPIFTLGDESSLGGGPKPFGPGFAPVPVGTPTITLGDESSLGGGGGTFSGPVVGPGVLPPIFTLGDESSLGGAPGLTFGDESSLGGGGGTFSGPVVGPGVLPPVFTLGDESSLGGTPGLTFGDEASLGPGAPTGTTQSADAAAPVAGQPFGFNFLESPGPTGSPLSPTPASRINAPRTFARSAYALASPTILGLPAQASQQAFDLGVAPGPWNAAQRAQLNATPVSAQIAAFASQPGGGAFEKFTGPTSSYFRGGSAARGGFALLPSNVDARSFANGNQLPTSLPDTWFLASTQASGFGVADFNDDGNPTDGYTWARGSNTTCSFDWYDSNGNTGEAAVGALPPAIVMDSGQDPVDPPPSFLVWGGQVVTAWNTTYGQAPNGTVFLFDGTNAGPGGTFVPFAAAPSYNYATSADSGSITTADTVIAGGSSAPQIPASTLAVGSAFRFVVDASVATNTASTQVFTLRYGATGGTGDTTIATVTLTSVSTALDPNFFRMIFDFVVNATGASGSITGSYSIANSNKDANAGIVGLTNATGQLTIPGTFNTSAAGKLSLSYVSGSANTRLVVRAPSFLECLKL